MSLPWDAWVIPPWIWRNPKIKAGAMRDVLVCLLWHQGSKGSAWPKIATLAAETGHGASTLRAALKELERLGFVEVVERRQAQAQGSVYRVIEHPLASEPPPEPEEDMREEPRQRPAGLGTETQESRENLRQNLAGVANETRENPRQISAHPPLESSAPLRQISAHPPLESSALEEPFHRTVPREPIARDARARAPARTRALSGVSLDGLSDPLKEHETVGGFEYVWRRWMAEGRALGLTMPSHPRGRDYQLVEELERLALDAVPDVVERTRFEAPEAFERLVGLAMRRYATQHREDAKRAPWKLGFVVSAWPELTKGAVPQASPQEPPASRPAPTPTAPKPSEGARETAEPPRVAWRAWVRASAAVDRPADRAIQLAHTRDLATLDRRIGELAAPIAAARGVTVDVVADELARDLVEGFLVAFQAERAPDAKEPPRLEWSPASLLASLPALLPQTQADPASRPKAAQTAA